MGVRMLLNNSVFSPTPNVTQRDLWKFDNFVKDFNANLAHRTTPRTLQKKNKN